MKKSYIFLLISFISYSFSISAQVGIGTETPASALEINSGLLLPRVDLNSLADNTTVTNPNGGTLVNGTMVYNTGMGSLDIKGFYVWDNGEWQSIKIEEVGDIKYDLNPADHDGWYLLDGRSSASLGGIIAMRATSLFGANLPDATDKSLKQQKTISPETIGSSTGNLNSEVILLTANMPIISFYGSISNAGSHRHAYTTDAKSHSHGYTDLGQYSISKSSLGNNPVAEGSTYTNKNTTAISHNHTFTLPNVGGHLHTATINNAGGNSTPISLENDRLTVNIFVYLAK